MTIKSMLIEHYIQSAKNRIAIAKEATDLPTFYFELAKAQSYLLSAEMLLFDFVQVKK